MIIMLKLNVNTKLMNVNFAIQKFHKMKKMFTNKYVYRVISVIYVNKCIKIKNNMSLNVLGNSLNVKNVKKN